MKSLATSAIAMAVTLSASMASAVVLDFENVPGGSTQNAFGDMPETGSSGYEGFLFSSTLDWVDVVDSTWNFGASSGDFAILNNRGGTGIITAADGGDFTFSGLWAKQWGTAPESGGPASPAPLIGTLQGYSDGDLIWSLRTSLNGSYQFFGAQSGAIDSLFLGFGNYFLVDDLALNETSPVPLPASLPLLLAGLGGLVALRRRKG